MSLVPDGGIASRPHLSSFPLYDPPSQKGDRFGGGDMARAKAWIRPDFGDSDQGRSQKFILGGYNFYCTILQSHILAA